MSSDLIKISGGSGMSDPFLLPSSSMIPASLGTALSLCPFLWYLNGKYRRASMRMVRYFITELQFGETGSDKEKKELREMLEDQIRIKEFCGEMGDDWACYGNAFARIHYPFDRYLKIPGGWHIPVSKIRTEMRFSLKRMKYILTDPDNPRKPIEADFIDLPVHDPSRVKLRLLNPEDMFIHHNEYSGSNDYLWRIPQRIVHDAERGRLHVVNEIHRKVLEAIRDKKDFQFDRGQIFHFKSPTVSGISNYGWGIPEVIANFRSIFQVQVYRKVDEAIGLDFLIPLRLFCPDPTGMPAQAGEMNLQLAGQFTAFMEQMIQARRNNPMRFGSMPFPTKFIQAGGDGKAMVPKDLIEFQTREMLDAAGYPEEFFRGSINIAQMPAAFRMFEQSNQFIFSAMTRFVQWASGEIQRAFGREQIETRLERPMYAHNAELQNLRLMLRAGGEISDATSLKGIVSDPVSDFRKKMEEDMEKVRIRREFEEQYAREFEYGIGGSEAGGSSPSGAGASTSPADIQSDAVAVAERWLSLDVGDRSKDMRQVEATNPNLYALAKQEMEKIRREAERQGRQSL